MSRSIHAMFSCKSLLFNRGHLLNSTLQNFQKMYRVINICGIRGTMDNVFQLPKSTILHDQLLRGRQQSQAVVRYMSTSASAKLKSPNSETFTTKRIVRKRKTKDSPLRDQEVFDVFAYCTADKYNLNSLARSLNEQGLYGIIALPSDMSEEALHVEALYGVENESRDVFFFKDGATVFWNMPEVERSSVLSFLLRHQERPYSQDLVQEEYERIEYTYQQCSSHLKDHEIIIQQASTEADLTKQRLEKYSFSNSLALSVSLSIWEAMLDDYVESIEFILQDLRDGKRIRISERDVLRKTGQLLTLRHLINLRSDLLDPPDAYWDREDLEQIYTKTCQYMDIARRTRVMNEKLNHCTELTSIIQEWLKDKHHTRLEWMIIILIMIEVVFEVVHTYERWSGEEGS